MDYGTGSWKVKWIMVPAPGRLKRFHISLSLIEQTVLRKLFYGQTILLLLKKTDFADKNILNNVLFKFVDYHHSVNILVIEIYLYIVRERKVWCTYLGQGYGTIGY